MAGPYALELSHFLHTDEDRIVADVATTPARDQMNRPQPPFDFYHEALEPTGIFGKVELQYR